MPYVLLIVIAVLAVLGVREVRAFVRRRRFAARASGDALSRLGDPRDAAATLLVQQAAYEGHLVTEQKAVIVSLMRETFGVTEGEAEGLFSFGRMAVGQVGDAANNLPRLLRPVKDHCTLAEMKDLVAMLEQVGEVTGPMTDQQRALVLAVAGALSLPSVQASA
jgi:uncharacterized tellurite resistance protein B-like protein